jgi:Beta-lactamase enzyme family
MTHDQLAQALLKAVRAQGFERTEDALLGGAPLRHFPSLDLAVIAFAPDAPPVWANVLFSREHPRGLVAKIGADAGPVRNIRFEADQRDAAGASIAWLPDADWQRLTFAPLSGAGPHRFVAPYPASLVKLMVAIGAARIVDDGRADWDEPVHHDTRTRTLAQWAEAMMVVSDNDATEAVVARLHRAGALAPDHNELHALFERHGLPTLRFADTRPDGGWRNADGAGVGHLQMTAWDTARVLWLLDADAPAAPWLEPGTPTLLAPDSRARLRSWLDDQALHEILSSTVLAGVSGWVRGLPARLPERWIVEGGSAVAGELVYPADVRSAALAATRRFAHKTGTTDNYASDAGIVRGERCHYIVALLSSLGRRYAPVTPCATTWRIPALGRAIDALFP